MEALILVDMLNCYAAGGGLIFVKQPGNRFPISRM
jgi:hypothetical protein